MRVDVTFKDVLEEIIGDFNEDLGKIEPAIELEDGQWRVASSMPVREFEDHFSKSLPLGDYLTIGSYVLELFDRTPYKDEVVSDSLFIFRVESIERQNIESLIVCLKDVSELPDGSM